MSDDAPQSPAPAPEPAPTDPAPTEAAPPASPSSTPAPAAGDRPTVSWQPFVLLALAIAGVLGLVSYNRPVGPLVEGDRLRAQGDLAGAARVYCVAAAGDRPEPARAALARLIEEDLPGKPLALVADVMAAIDEESARARRSLADAAVLEPWVLAAESRQAEDPRLAYAILESIGDHVLDQEALRGARVRVLRAALEKDPTDLEAAVDLALVFEQANDMERCEALLAPFAERLAEQSGEGTRMLGQIRARRGDLAGADALLVPYVRAGLEEMRGANAEIDAAFGKAWEAARERMQKGLAPRAFYEQYEQVPEADRQAFTERFLEGEVEKDPVFAAKRAEMRRVEGVVQVALDLAVVKLRRAQREADAGARRRLLEESEEVFLAIESLIGKTDQYRLFMGQVSFWLGNDARGRRLFDELLASKGRTPTALIHVAGALRDVGADAAAGELLKEAWEKAADAKTKQAAAAAIASLQEDPAEQVRWLERAAGDDPRGLAALAGARGREALAEGDEAAAVRHLREAASGFEAIGEDDPSALNEAALAWLALFDATFARDDFDRGIARLEKLAARVPDDPGVLFNLAHALLQRAILDTIGDRLRLDLLGERIEVDLLRELYADQAGRAEVAARLAAHADAARAVETLGKVALLAPKSPRAYQLLLRVHAFTMDADALATLERQLAGAEPDLGPYLAAARAFHAGERDEEMRAGLDARIARLERAVAAAREAGHAPTLAAAVSRLVIASHDACFLGREVDADRVVALAEEAVAAHPTSSARGALINALMTRASRRLAASQPAHAKTVEKVGRALGATYAIAWGLEGEQPDAALRDAILADPDAARALDLTAEIARAFPDSSNPSDWALLRARHSELAEASAKNVREDAARATIRRIQTAIAPLSPRGVLEAWWAARIAGDEAAADAVLADAVARGVPLP